MMYVGKNVYFPLLTAKTWEDVGHEDACYLKLHRLRYTGRSGEEEKHDSEPFGEYKVQMQKGSKCPLRQETCQLTAEKNGRKHI